MRLPADLDGLSAAQPEQRLELGQGRVPSASAAPCSARAPAAAMRARFSSRAVASPASYRRSVAASSASAASRLLRQQREPVAGPSRPGRTRSRRPAGAARRTSASSASGPLQGRPGLPPPGGPPPPGIQRPGSRRRRNRNKSSSASGSPRSPPAQDSPGTGARPGSASPGPPRSVPRARATSAALFPGQCQRLVQRQDPLLSQSREGRTDTMRPRATPIEVSSVTSQRQSAAAPFGRAARSDARTDARPREPFSGRGRRRGGSWRGSPLPSNPGRDRSGPDPNLPRPTSSGPEAP